MPRKNISSINHTNTSENRQLNNLTAEVNSISNTQTNILGVINTQLENISNKIDKNISVNESILPAHKTVVPNSDKLNVLCIMLDELGMLESLPKKFRDSLPGYNAMKNMGINFTNFHTNRQMCSPSRCVYMSGKIDTGVVDNVEQSWQYSCKENVYDLNSTGKLFAINAPNHITCFYGKSHLDSKLIPNYQILPRFATNTVNAMKVNGFDKFNTFGDNLHYGHGFFSDPHAYNMSHPLDSVSYDIMEDNMKYEGAIPFLKARNIDKKKFHLQINFHNPHDIMHFWTVPSQNPLPMGDMSQYGVPYYDEQKAEGLMSTTGTPNDSIYNFNEDDQDAYLKNPTLIKNWFKEFGDTTYEKYKTDTSTLLYSETFTQAYWSDTTKSLNPFMFGVNLLLKYNFTIPDKSMIVNWKNYQNAYLTMIQQADSYIEGIMKYLISSGLIDNTSVVFYSDHGESAGAYGLTEKGNPYKPSENIPLCIWSPLLDDTLKGTSTDKLVSTIDINPTLMKLANIDNAVIDNMDGVTIFTKNSNNKLILNTDNNIGTFGIHNNWQTWTSIFFTLKYGDLTYITESLTAPNDIWYNSILPMKLANAHIIFNTFVDGKKYKLIIWYNLHALFKFDIEKMNTIITLTMFDDVILSLKTTYMTTEEINTIDMIVATYSPNIIDKTLGEIIDWLNLLNDDSQFINLALMGIIFELVINIFGNNNNNNNNGLVSMNTPTYDMNFNDYNDIIEGGGFLYQELYNLDADPNELHNLIDPIQNTSEEIETNKKIIEDDIWDNFQEVMNDKNCENLYNTLTFIRTYYSGIFVAIEAGVSTFAAMTDDQFNDFVYPDKLKPINALMYDSMS